MADQTVIVNVERAGRASFSGAQAYSGPASLRRKDASPEAARSEKTEAQQKSAETEELVDSVRLVRDETSGRSFVEILDKKTGEVMYQIPPEEVRKLAELLKDMTGSMVNTVA
jgi:uncharacterized FlaG/YvyC family protein